MEIKKELVIDSPPSRVYEAITDIKQLSQWFPDVVSLDPKIGGKIVFKFSGDSSTVPDVIEGKITGLESNKKLSYTWSHPDVPDFPITKVTWNLEKIRENQTRVTIIHSGFVDEKTMSSYDRRWLWITEHLDSFAASERPVSIKEQIMSTLIPGVDIWAFYRIKKLRKAILYITIPSIIATVLLMMLSFSTYDDFQDETMTSEEFAVFQLSLFVGIIVFILSVLAFTNYLVRRWTREWNKRFLEAPKKNRPIGLFVLSFVYVFDAGIMAVFLGFYAGVPEFSSFVTETPELFNFVEDFAIVNFGDWLFELGVFVIAVDALIVVGLLSARTAGRNLAIGCAFGGIAFNVLVFGMFGLVVNGILLWYLFRTTTKESFKISV